MKSITGLLENWMETKRLLKQKFSMLTHADVLFIDGKEHEMWTRLQSRLGKTETEIHQLLAEL